MREMNCKDVKVITSANIDMMYAPASMKIKMEQLEKEGWTKFGNLTTIYDETTEKYVMLQVMTK